VEPLTFLGSLLATSLLAGGIGAILGLGGGILLVPVLTQVYGIDLHVAMGASIISVIATSSGAAAAYLRVGLSNVRIGLFLAMATVVGAVIGAYLVGVVPERALELILGAALAYSAVATFQQLGTEAPLALPASPAAVQLALEGTYYDSVLRRQISYRADRVWRGVGAMFGAGFLSGLLGIGSGAFKVLAMDHFMRLPMKVSTATSNFMIGITAAASASVFLRRGDIHPLVVTPVALGVLAGSYAGARVMSRLRNTSVRKLFLPVIVYLAASMILRGVGMGRP